MKTPIEPQKVSSPTPEDWKNGQEMKSDCVLTLSIKGQFISEEYQRNF